MEHDSARRPNIILIVSDDHGYADRSAFGTQDDVNTPALDRLASEGVTCTDAYVTAPICSPSRSGLIAGQYQQRWGGLWFDSSAMCPEDVPTLAEELQTEGYATGYFGKVHYGNESAGDRGTPPQHGFDESMYGLAGQSMGRLNYMHHSAAAQAEYGQEAAMRMAVQPLWDGDTPVEVEGFLTAEIGERARKFIASHETEPFFTMVAFNAVHNFCWQLPPEELAKRGLPSVEDWHPGASDYVDWYDGAISPNLPDGRAYYLAQLDLMDAEVAKMLDQLDDLGLAEETLVIYLTDNGGSTCNYGVNAPLHGTKYTLWEGGIRVPFIARWPKNIPAGSQYSELVSSMDIMPTALAAAGAKTDFAERCDGRNLLPEFTDAGETDSRELHWDCGWQWAVRDGDFKAMWVDSTSRVAGYVRDVEHTDPGSGYSLFNLADDVGERHNLAETDSGRLQRMIQLHERWRSDVGLPAR